MSKTATSRLTIAGPKITGSPTGAGRRSGSRQVAVRAPSESTLAALCCEGGNDDGPDRVRAGDGPGQAGLVASLADPAAT